MPLVVELRSDNGEVLKRTGETSGAVEVSYPSFDDPAWPLLRYVDPYGTTYFNSLQMDGLLPEVRAARGRCDDHAQVRLLGQLVELAEEYARRPHSLLVFIGD